MLNKKGFTLVELLATVAIMLLITAIAIPLSMNYINKGKETEYQLVADEIIQATDKYYKEHKDEIEIPGKISLNAIAVYVDEQYKNNDGEIIDPRDKSKPLEGNVCLTKSENRINYLYDPNKKDCN